MKIFKPRHKGFSSSVTRPRFSPSIRPSFIRSSVPKLVSKQFGTLKSVSSLSVKSRLPPIGRSFCSDAQKPLQEYLEELKQVEDVKIPLSLTQWDSLYGKLSPEFRKSYTMHLRLSKHSNLHDLVYTLPRWGIGSKVTRTIWKRPGCYWTIVQYIPELTQRGRKRGKAYGFLTWRHVVDPELKVLKIQGQLKKEWKKYEFEFYQRYEDRLKKDEAVRDIPVLAHTHTVDPGFKQFKLGYQDYMESGH